MQQLMAQAQKMQRELKKAKAALAEKEFEISKGGAVKVTVLGNKTVKSVEIQDDAFNKEDKDMVQDMITMAINEAIEQIDTEEAEINEAITSQSTPMGF